MITRQFLERSIFLHDMEIDKKREKFKQAETSEGKDKADREMCELIAARSVLEMLIELSDA